jgi:hypothetical protein
VTYQIGFLGLDAAVVNAISNATEPIDGLYGAPASHFPPPPSGRVRDFRGWQNPSTLGMVLDTGDHDLWRIVIPSMRPPSALLTPDACDAILSASRLQNLDVVSIVDTG